MLKGFSPRLSFANVMSSIAVFLALGGGYAVAFSGSGSLQKAGVDGVPATFTDVRTLTGFGKLQARCDVPGGDTEVRFHNSSGSSVTAVGAFVATTNSVALSAANGMDSGAVSFASSFSTARFHMVKAADDSKAQVDLTISAAKPGTDCENSSVRILALNTQE